jgi:hypothetical protein
VTAELRPGLCLSSTGAALDHEQLSEEQGEFYLILLEPTTIQVVLRLDSP